MLYVADEISVTRGTTVKALYRDDQWIYVQVSDGRRGFVPQTYCKLLLNGELKWKLEHKRISFRKKWKAWGQGQEWLNSLEKFKIFFRREESGRMPR